MSIAASIPTPRATHGGPIQYFYHPHDTPRRPVVARGEGIYLWDTAGRQYTDASSGPITSNLGHGNARVIAAADAQIRQVAYANHMFFENEPNLRLAELVTRHAGAGLERAFFVSGGSEANESAIKIARQHAVRIGQASRWKVLSRNPSYHGSTLGALSISGDPQTLHTFAPLLCPHPKVPTPFTYRVPADHTPESYAQACVQALEDCIVAEGAETVLAFILEPVGGVATGALVACDQYYRGIRDVCTRYGVLLIYDEVMCGAGRTGRFLSAHYWPDAQPDIVTMAKGLGAGYTPLGAVLVSRALADALADAGGFMHGFTYASNPLSCAIGHAVIEELLERQLVENAAKMGTYLHQQLRRVQHDSTILGDIRGRGLLMAIEVVANRDTQVGFAAEVNATARLVAMAMERGVLLYARRTAEGQHGEWLMLAPPLIVTADQIDDLCSRIQDTLKAAEQTFAR